MAEPELKLYYEDTETVDGRMVTQTTWREVVPLMVFEDVESEREFAEPTIIGAVSGIRREDKTVLGTPSVSMEPYVGLACQPSFDHVTSETMSQDNQTMTIVGPRLSGVVLGRHPAWVGLEIGERDA